MRGLTAIVMCTSMRFPMANFLRNFIKDEYGNATIDWIVLTASLVTLGLTIGYVVSDSANGVATDINTTMSSIEPPSQDS